MSAHHEEDGRMDGHASNADDAESGGEASPSAGGKADGHFALLEEFPLK